jgi:hypothetical protein
MPLEIFARAESKSYFERLKQVFQIETKDGLLPILEGIKERKLGIPQFGHMSIDPWALINFEKLASLP